MAPELSATMEDYLETVYALQQREGQARVKGIAETLQVALPTVTSALRTLKGAGLVEHERYGAVELTPEGLRRGQQIQRRHEALVGFLTSILRIEPETAQSEACRMEHAIGSVTLARLAAFLEFVQHCPRGGEHWLEHLADRWDDLECDHDCAECIAGIDVSRQSQAPRPAETVSLAECGPGCRGVVMSIEGRGPTRRRIADMGVARGVPIEVERVAPLGDPLEVKVRGYHLSLRKSEAARVQVAVSHEMPRRRQRRRGRRAPQGR